jgi:hypothetical protein
VDACIAQLAVPNTLPVKLVSLSENDELSDTRSVILVENEPESLTRFVTLVEKELLSDTRFVTLVEKELLSDTKLVTITENDPDAVSRSASCVVCDPDTISNKDALDAIDAEYGESIAYDAVPTTDPVTTRSFDTCRLPDIFPPYLILSYDIL